MIEKKFKLDARFFRLNELIFVKMQIQQYLNNIFAVTKVQDILVTQHTLFSISF